MLEFDADGKFVNAWGGDGQGYDGPHRARHHDRLQGVVWIGGSAATSRDRRRHAAEVHAQGKFLQQIGAGAQSKGNADTENVNRPADIFV